MFEFKKICDSFEKLTPLERNILLTEKSVKLFKELNSIKIPKIDPIDVIAGFVMSSCIADGKISEKEYLMIYPSLVRVFGENFNYNSVKSTFGNHDIKKAITNYTKNMISIMNFLNEELKWDVIMLCLCIVSIDEKITLKEKNYIRDLCDAF